MTGNIGNWPRMDRIGPGSSGYPRAVLDAFGSRAPVLTFMGNSGLLDRPGIGFCGSRKASKTGIEATRDCVEQAVRSGFVVVSGNAAGIDSVAHAAALSAGGATILVLPEGIDHFRIRKSFEAIWDWERVLVVSQFEPGAVWQGYRAMARNDLIIALSDAMVVIEAGEKGGTLHAGLKALKSRKPLFVVNYRNIEAHAPGNARLLRAGACALSKSRATGRAGFDRVVASVRDGAGNGRTDEQLALL